jgi:EAL domain-containing protein (putative c-di-GMP-specific phosphodiesterase class I)
LSVPVCVEGIECEQTYEAVITLGCAIGQGWYFGKPMRSDQVRELLGSRSRDEAAAQAPASNAING